MILNSSIHHLVRCMRRGYSSSSPVLVGDKVASTKKFTPFIHVGDKLEEVEKLQENVELRKLGIDPIKLKSLWDFLKHLRATKRQLQQRKTQINNYIQDLKKLGKNTEATEELTKLKVEWRVIREDLKTLATAFWEVEEKILITGFMLPNELHPETPSHEDKVVTEFGSRPAEETTATSHLDLGRRLNLIDYRDPSCYFLKNEAALFELACSRFSSRILKKNGFICFSNPDCVRSVIVEGCGLDPNRPEYVFAVKENVERPGHARNYKLHLVGGASLYPFCAFHTNQTVCFSSLPIKYFTVGRQYSPSSPESSRGLYETWQRTTTELFVLTADNCNEMMSAFRETVDVVKSMYERLERHFRIVHLSASSLDSWECLRASFQMYSCHEKRYIETGRISLSDAFICQRLLMMYQMSNDDRKKRFTKMISGTAIDVTKALACMLEDGDYSNLDRFSMPDCLGFSDSPLR